MSFLFEEATGEFMNIFANINSVPSLHPEMFWGDFFSHICLHFIKPAVNFVS